MSKRPAEAAWTKDGEPPAKQVRVHRDTEERFTPDVPEMHLEGHRLIQVNTKFLAPSLRMSIHPYKDKKTNADRFAIRMRPDGGDEYSDLRIFMAPGNVTFARLCESFEPKYGLEKVLLPGQSSKAFAMMLSYGTPYPDYMDPEKLSAITDPVKQDRARRNLDKTTRLVAEWQAVSRTYIHQLKVKTLKLIEKNIGRLMPQFAVALDKMSNKVYKAARAMERQKLVDAGLGGKELKTKLAEVLGEIKVAAKRAKMWEVFADGLNEYITREEYNKRRQEQKSLARNKGESGFEADKNAIDVESDEEDAEEDATAGGDMLSRVHHANVASTPPNLGEPVAFSAKRLSDQTRFTEDESGKYIKNETVTDEQPWKVLRTVDEIPVYTLNESGNNWQCVCEQANKTLTDLQNTVSSEKDAKVTVQTFCADDIIAPMMTCTIYCIDGVFKDVKMGFKWRMSDQNPQKRDCSFTPEVLVVAYVPWAERVRSPREQQIATFDGRYFNEDGEADDFTDIIANMKEGLRKHVQGDVMDGITSGAASAVTDDGWLVGGDDGPVGDCGGYGGSNLPFH